MFLVLCLPKIVRYGLIVIKIFVFLIRYEEQIKKLKSDLEGSPKPEEIARYL